MFRVDGPDSQPNFTLSVPGSSPGFFRAGVPQLGELATIVTADWANIIQEEIISVINWAGIPLDKSSITQLRDALIRMFRPQIAPDIGTVNAVNLSLPKGPALEWGLKVCFTPAANNTGPTTISYNGSPPQQVYSPAWGGQLEGGELWQGWFYTVQWNGAGWMLTDHPGGNLPVPDGWHSKHAINLGQFPALFDGRFPGAFESVFPAAWEQAWQVQFPPSFQAAWDLEFPPAFDYRFSNTFPPNFDQRFLAEFPGAFGQEWWNWVMPNFFPYAPAYNGPFGGWWQQPSGLILQCGQFNVSYGAGQIVPFPRPFPNLCAAIVGSEFIANGGWGTWDNGPAPTIYGFDTPARDYFRAWAAQFGPGQYPPRWAGHADAIGDPPGGWLTMSWQAFGW